MRENEGKIRTRITPNTDASDFKRGVGKFLGELN